MARLLLLRHGQSTWNAAGRWQGWADPPLSPAGEEQAMAAARALEDADITAVVASDLQRASRTGVIVADHLGLPPVETDRRLRERDVGEWSGHRVADIHERWPGQLEAWRAGQLERPPGGEANDDLLRRVKACVEELAARSGTIAVVTHGGVIHAVVHHLGGVAVGIGNLAGRWLEEGLVLGDEHGLDIPPGATTVL